jgi:hypothetical protein
MVMKWNFAFSLPLLAIHLLFAQSELACPTDKIHSDPATHFCDSLRQRNDNDWIFAAVMVNGSIEYPLGDTTTPITYKTKCLYLLSKYSFYTISMNRKDITPIASSDSSYSSLGHGVVMSKETALKLIQEDYVLYIDLVSGPRTPETQQYWPSILHQTKKIGKPGFLHKTKNKIDILGRYFEKVKYPATQILYKNVQIK